MPAIARNSVDLPLPDLPLIAVDFAGMQGEAAALQQQPPVGQGKVEVAQAQVGAGRDRPLRTVPGQRPGGDDRAVEGRETFDLGAPRREGGVVVDDPGHRALHLAERIDDAHQPAELHLAREIAGGGDDDGEDNRHLRIAGDQRVELLGPPHDAQPVLDHVDEAAAQLLLLLLLAAVEGDALHVLAQAH